MAIPSLKLYLLTGSSAVFPHILLRHCGLRFEPVIVKIADLQSDSYINTKRQVPALLMDDKDLITENPAIAFAINQLAPDKKIFGVTPLENVRVHEWLAWIAGPLHAQSWSTWMRPFRFTTDKSEEALAAVKESGRLRCIERYSTLEGNLHATGPWALGQNFTAVDAYLLVFYRLAANRLGLDMRQMYPRWTRVIDNLLELEGTKEALRYEEEQDQKSS